jgi:hypothetical protein
MEGVNVQVNIHGVVASSTSYLSSYSRRYWYMHSGTVQLQSA